MSFDTPNGTRGSRQLSGRLFRWLNNWASCRLRRKSGLERTDPADWFPGTDGSWLIVASAAGAARNPAWYYNRAACTSGP
jgi:hypothetical protein